MLPIPPIAYAAYAGTQSIRQTEEKTEQVKRAQTEEKDSAAAADRYEHTVESTDEVQPIHDEEQKHPEQEKHGKHHRQNDGDEDDLEHLDLTA